MIMSQCPMCKEWVFTGTTVGRSHVCPPLWYCQIEEWNAPVWDKQYASDAEEAATKYAERWDVDDHPLLQGETVEVLVCSDPIDETETVIKFCCNGEAVPSYHATKIKPAEADNGNG